MNPRDVFPRTLQYLIAIAEYGSFTQAAKALHVSQPTLSQQIKELEYALQIQLLDRSGQYVRLTDAGEIYIRFARSAWEELNTGMRAIHDVQNLSRGSLRVGWTPITEYFACSLLVGFNRLYPGIVLSTIEMPRNDIQDALSRDTIDVGITFSEPFSIKSKSNEFKTHRLFEEPICVVVGNSHPRYGQQEEMNLQDFAQESLVLLNTNYTLRRQVDRYCAEHDIAPHISIKTSSIRVVINIIQASSLATVLPIGIAKQYGLHPIRLTPKLPNKLISLIHRTKGYKSQATIEFTKLALDWSQI